MEEQELRTVVAENLIYYRKQKGWTQAELAAALNYSDKSVSKWERGDGLPDLLVLKRLADQYKITVNDFLIPCGEKSQNAEAIAPVRKPVRFRTRVLVPTLSVGVAWLAACVLFFLLQVIFPTCEKFFLIFIWTIPISFIISIVFTSIWWGPILRFSSVSGLIWTFSLAVFLTFSSFSHMALIFAVAGVLEILTILWFILFKPFPSEEKEVEQMETRQETK
jgi:transcriptional regulator with XRE-family HTH domain